jgi:quinolinate synthase
MLKHLAKHPDGDFIVATETGMLHPLHKAAPRARLTAVKVPADIAERARIPIERMVAIG